jgi:hypothetical protein
LRIALTNGLDFPRSQSGMKNAPKPATAWENSSQNQASVYFRALSAPTGSTTTTDHGTGSEGVSNVSVITTTSPSAHDDFTGTEGASSISTSGLTKSASDTGVGSEATSLSINVLVAALTASDFAIGTDGATVATGPTGPPTTTYSSGVDPPPPYIPSMVPETVVSIPHFSLPFRFAGGRVVVIEQDSPEEIRQSVETVARYQPGIRPELPEFGIPDQSFRNAPDLDVVHRAVNRWEPRAQTVIETDRDLAELVDNIRINVEDDDR